MGASVGMVYVPYNCAPDPVVLEHLGLVLPQMARSRIILESPGIPGWYIILSSTTLVLEKDSSDLALNDGIIRNRNECSQTQQCANSDCVVTTS